MTRYLKVLREAACLQVAERLFQSFTPLNEKHFLPFSVPFFRNLRSVDVLRSLYDVLCEFFLNKLRKYGGASSFKLLKTIVLDSMSINSLIVFHPSFSINWLLGVSKLLFVTILAALFCNFCKRIISVVPAQPHTEQQYRKWGSTMLV